jgi:hypothetical protein
MINETTIHVAHAISRKGGVHYRARAFASHVLDGRPVKHSFTISIDDSPTEAERNAVQYVKEKYRRDGLEAPTRIENHGRIAGALLDAHLFGPTT